MKRLAPGLALVLLAGLALVGLFRHGGRGAPAAVGPGTAATRPASAAEIELASPAPLVGHGGERTPAEPDPVVEVAAGAQPDPDSATWRGRVIDEAGRPLSTGSLTLYPAGVDANHGLGRGGITATLERGEFEVSGLSPGVVHAVYYVPGDPDPPAGVDEARFDSPGPVERDVSLAPRSIVGVVVERGTGKPVEGGGVVATGTPANQAPTMVTVDPGGRFALRGLAEGRHDLFVTATGYASSHLSAIPVPGTIHGGVLEPLTIEVERGGSLTVRLEGCEPGMGFTVQFEGPQRGLRHGGNHSTDDSGACTGTWTLAPDVWTVHLEATGHGRASREVVLVAGQEAEAVFLGGDFLRFEGRVDLEGVLRLASGSPVEGASLFLYCVEGELSPGEDRMRAATTDAEGRFGAEGLVPGRWRVRGSLPDGGEVDFADLVVPPGPPDPVVLELAVPGGRVVAALADATTGEHFGLEGPVWWAFLKDASTESLVAQLQGGHRGPRAELVGVPAGRLVLEIHARGYFDLAVPPFEVGADAVHDLGTLELEPSAVLAVEALAPDGTPVEVFSVAVDGVDLPSWEGYDRRSGSARFDGMTGGRVVVRVSAGGYLPTERVVDLRAGEETHERFELEALPR